MQRAPERQAWIDQQQQHAIRHEGAAHVESVGTFGKPEYLPSTSSEITLNALHRTISDARSATGKIESPVRELGDSPNWNALAGGSTPEPRHNIGTDMRVQGYLFDRQGEVDTAAQEVKTVYPELVKELSAGIKDGIHKGYIPSEVASRLPSLEQTNVKVVDIGIVREEDPLAAAEYDSSGDTVRIGHAHVGDTATSMMVKHELLHKVSGGTFVQDPETGSYSRSRISFGNHEHRHKDEHENRRTGINEAVNQHLTMGVETGDFETFDPDRRTDRDRTYYGSRKVVATGLDRSQGVMSVRALTRASFEDTSASAMNMGERRELVKEASAAYGPGAMRKISALANAAEAIAPDDPKYHDRLQELTDRIHAPELNADGTVCAVGSIDIEGL